MLSDIKRQCQALTFKSFLKSPLPDNVRVGGPTSDELSPAYLV